MTAEGVLSVDALIRAASADPYEQGMIVNVRETGIRPFELRDLRRDHLEPTGWTTQGRGKTKRAHYVLIAGELYELLRAVSPTTESGDGYVFPGRSSPTGPFVPDQPMADATTYHLVARYFKAAAIEADQNGPRMLRHTFIENMKKVLPLELVSILAGNKSIATLSGGASSNMTFAVYGKHREQYVCQQYLEAREKLGWRTPTGARQGTLDEAMAEASWSYGPERQRRRGVRPEIGLSDDAIGAIRSASVGPSR